MRFLLVDALLCDAGGFVTGGRKCVARSEDYLEWHFPDRAIFPGMLLLEACTQVAGWQAAAASGFRDWILLSGVTLARFDSFITPGQVIEMTVSETQRAEERRDYAATCRHQETVVARLEFSGRCVALSSLMDPDAAARRFEELALPRPDPAA